MSRQEDFLTRSQHCWFAVGCLYWPPYRFKTPSGGESLAFQVLTTTDVESQYMMRPHHPTREPAPFTSAELLEYVELVFGEHGKPKEGVLFLPSVWRATEELLDHPMTHERVVGAWEMGLRLPEMDAGERYALATALSSSHGLDAAWDEEQIPDLEDLLNH